MRRAAKVDANQAEIVKVLRQKGASVACTHQLGKGYPDLTVGIPGKLINLLLEVKQGNSGLTDDEAIFHCTWRGQLDIVRTPEEACELYDKYVHLTTLLKGELR